MTQQEERVFTRVLAAREAVLVANRAFSESETVIAAYTASHKIILENKKQKQLELDNLLNSLKYPVAETEGL